MVCSRETHYPPALHTGSKLPIHAHQVVFSTEYEILSIGGTKVESHLGFANDFILL